MKPALRILLVEDERAYARLLAEHLREHADIVLVGTAETLEDGIRMANELSPDVVMLDLGLPDSEGIETVVHFNRELPRLPIVILSGLDSVEVALDAMRRGAQEYLVKGQAEIALLRRVLHFAIERKRLQELEQLLVGVVSHDLRNPLQAIILGCELMLPASTDATRTKLDRVLRSAERAQALVSDLLDVTRARLGGLLPIDPTRHDLIPLVQALVHEQRTVSGREIALNAPATLDVFMDGPRIVQALGNLLRNAIQHGESSSKIAVDISTQGDELHLSVHNTGAPIRPELMGSLFEPLARAKLPHSSGSIGLGLYIVREIAKAHGGQIAVHSTAEGGTRFTMSLPLSDHAMP